MKEFDYIIIGGGCAGLSLAYELDIHNKLENKTLAIIEPRKNYERDKTWSFWKIIDHNFVDCVKKSWKDFSINLPKKTKYIKCDHTPYQTIDSGLFYKKIINKLRQNKNIHFFKSINEINMESGYIFNSVPTANYSKNLLWQHFMGLEIETYKDFFDEEIFNLMDFNCEQKDAVHFFYTLPFSKTKALVETTWLSKLNNDDLLNYEDQLKNYINNNLNIKKYKISYSEKGAIPLFQQKNIKRVNEMYIGSAGGMTRLSTGYTFLNIQEQSKHIRENIENIENTKIFKINKKYNFLDNVFLNVLSNHPDKMPNIFFKLFEAQPKTVINFLSNKSSFVEDLSIIFKMPKIVFLKNLLR
jgi:lycopene beta-cyclase|uniref:lycopene cyclase family protein n=1 Tax=Candidatus Pelagibacter sp. TaxID=2024849 RepID=UPI00404B15FA